MRKTFFVHIKIIFKYISQCKDKANKYTKLLNLLKVSFKFILDFIYAHGTENI